MDERADVKDTVEHFTTVIRHGREGGPIDHLSPVHMQRPLLKHHLPGAHQSDKLRHFLGPLRTSRMSIVTFAAPRSTQFQFSMVCFATITCWVVQYFKRLHFRTRPAPSFSSLLPATPTQPRTSHMANCVVKDARRPETTEKPLQLFILARQRSSCTTRQYRSASASAAALGHHISKLIHLHLHYAHHQPNRANNLAYTNTPAGSQRTKSCHSSLLLLFWPRVCIIWRIGAYLHHRSVHNSHTCRLGSTTSSTVARAAPAFQIWYQYSRGPPDALRLRNPVGVVHAERESRVDRTINIVCRFDISMAIDSDDFCVNEGEL